MPQEFHVIRCFACLVFQVHQAKKKPKWQCKMCGEKQSVRKVYGKGAGKECRLLVQSLNMTAGQITDEDTNCQPSLSELTEESEMSQMTEKSENKVDLDNAECPQPSSKWNRFFEEEPDEASIPEEVGCQGLEFPSEYFITERPSRFKRKKGQNSGLSNKRSRQEGRKSEWDTLAESNQQESGLYPGCSSVQEPSWESHCSQDDVRQRNKNINPSSRQTNISNLENDSITSCESYTFGQLTKKAVDTVSVTSNRKDQKQQCKGMTIKSASHHKSTNVPKGNNSKWAVFAAPDSDVDEEDDFGEENLIDEIHLHRENSEVTELLENCTSGNSSGAFSTQQEMSELNNSNSDRLSSVSTFYDADQQESQPYESRSSAHNTIQEYQDSYPNKLEGKGSYDHHDCHPVSRTDHTDILSNIQNSISSSVGSRKHMVSEIQPTFADSATSSSGKNTGVSGSHGGNLELVCQPFQLPDECLEDLPDDFDVW